MTALKKRTLVGLWCLAFVSTSFAQTQPVGLDSLPPCALTETHETRSTSEWQRVDYQQIELRVPPGLIPSSALVMGHGYQEWVGEGVTVSLSFGYFGLHSFDAFEGERCRAEINGQSALVIEQSSRAGASVSVWIPELHLPIPLPYHPFVTARSVRRDDISLLRTIAWSMKMADPQ